MAEIIIKPKAFTKEWYGYVWEYYKYHIVIGVIAVIFIASLVVRSLTAVKYDMNINFVATTTLLSENAEKIASACGKNSDDLNKNGRVDVALNQINFTETARMDPNMYTALQNRLMALLSARDEILYVVDSYMLDQITNMEHISDKFYKADEWAGHNANISKNHAVSLAESEMFESLGIDSSDLYVLVARYDEEDGFKPNEENAIKIAKFLIK